MGMSLVTARPTTMVRHGVTTGKLSAKALVWPLFPADAPWVKGWALPHALPHPRPRRGRGPRPGPRLHQDAVGKHDGRGDGERHPLGRRASRPRPGAGGGRGGGRAPSGGGDGGGRGAGPSPLPRARPPGTRAIPEPSRIISLWSRHVAPSWSGAR